MASMTLTGSLPKFLHVSPAMVRRNPSSRVLVTAAPRPPQGGAAGDAQKSVGEAAREVAGEAKKSADETRGMASAAAAQVADTTQDLSHKAQQLAQDAWGSAKETAQKVKDAVVGKAEDTKESIKDDAEAVKRAMNTKNNR
ncbi:uncharacterized protein [Elaeis guineensis]|uniref:Uncharacterized protein At4g13230 n=1 Tax=Elaeis guineensis var. tenera TaxID=51953 RepID=A0A6I9S2C6_ELAGV|nr:uncharacterized protein At4g13230 [Elaeis guineensis]